MNAREENLERGPEAARTSIDRDYPRSPPTSPVTGKRFIVEPQVLNAALELELGGGRPLAPSLPHTAGGGLPPPPRPYSNGRKGKHPRSTPSSPATSIDHSIPSLPNSPSSSPYSNGPNTPGASSDVSPHASASAKPSPRLSNFLRGESITFNTRRRSTAEVAHDLQEGLPEEPQTAGLRQWTSRETSDGISPLDSVPSSPEMPTTPVDGARPSRHNRYLSGLQKIARLGKAKGVFAEGVRGGRRLSDAEWDPRRQDKGSGGGEGKYRWILPERGARAGEGMRQPASVPSSPVAAGLVKRAEEQEGEDETGGGRYSRRPSGGSGSRGGGGGGGRTADSALAWLSHGRRASTTSSLASAALSLSPSDSSLDPPSSATEPRISISSTIYPSSSNNHSFDIARYPPSLPGRSSMRSPDSESFIDLASPTFSPTDYSIPPPGPAPRTEQPIHHASAHDTRNDSMTDFQSRSPKPRLARLVAPAGAAKPPIPTAPKPDFSRLSLSGQPKAGKAQGSPLSNFASDLDRSLSGLPTTNTLSSRERSQRVRQTHKLTQLFGQTPGVSPISPPGTFDVAGAGGCLPVPTLGLAAKRKHALHRPAASLSDEVVTPVYDGAGELVWPPPDGTRYVSLAPRRHSAPLSPDEFSFMIGPGRRSHESDASRPLSGGDGDGASVIAIGSAGAGSPTSFIDLSDEEGAADGDGDGDGDRLSEILAETPRGARSRARRAAGGPLSDSLSPASEAEDERRRKREKLAKLHRFLGSRVPQHLVLGPLDLGAPLPPVAVPSPSAPSPADDADPRRPRMRRRRSSSAAEFSRTWSDDIDRLKEELNEREKAINVRRAVKMEKMFGVAPPQTLYHTRAPTSSSSSSLSANPKPPSPRAPPRSPSAPAFRLTPSESAPKPKSKKKSRRPGTADSAQPLMGSDSQDYNFLADAARSSVYMHYRHSLNSLNDIMDRDDRESLAELHDYLSAHHQFDGPGPVPVSPLADEVSVATPKAERRRSLPSRTSIASFTSEISLIPAATPDAEPSFQQRRRRAAKLTHFFGVDYRELMNEVLESIEKGLEEERGRGTLRPDEVRDLQQKLVSLKSKRNSLRE